MTKKTSGASVIVAMAVAAVFGITSPPATDVAATEPTGGFSAVLGYSAEPGFPLHGRDDNVPVDVDLETPLAFGMRNSSGFDWTTVAAEDSIAMVASYDAHTFGREFFYSRSVAGGGQSVNEVPMDEIFALNPGITIGLYDHPGVWAESVAGEEYMMRTMYDALWPYRVMCADDPGEVAYSHELNFYWHTEDPDAMAAYMNTMREWQSRLSDRFGEAAEYWGCFHDGRPPIYYGDYIDSTGLWFNGWPDLDGDGIATHNDWEYLDWGISESEVVKRQQIAIVDSLEAEFGEHYYSVFNGQLAWTDSVAVRHWDAILIEDLPQWPPFMTNGMGDVLAGGKRTSEVTLGETIDEFISIASYARWQETPGGPDAIMNPTGPIDPEGPNLESVMFASICVGVGFSPSTSLKNIAYPDNSLHTTLSPLGALEGYSQVGEYIHGRFVNGDAYITTSFAVGDEGDQTDYWAVTDTGDTLISHWHGEETYTYCYGYNENIPTSEYDRYFDGYSHGAAKGPELDASEPTTVGAVNVFELESTTLPMSGTAGSFGLLGFNGSKNSFDADMRRTLAKKKVKSATLHLYAGWRGLTLAGTDSLYVIGCTNERLADWKVVADPNAAPTAADATFAKMQQGLGVDWGEPISGLTHHTDIGLSDVAIGGITVAANGTFEIDVTELYQDAAEMNTAGDDFENPWGGLWLYSKGTAAITNIFTAQGDFGAWLTVEVYAPWYDPDNPINANQMSDSWDIREANSCWTAPEGAGQITIRSGEPGIDEDSATALVCTGTTGWTRVSQTPNVVITDDDVVVFAILKEDNMPDNTDTRVALNNITEAIEHLAVGRWSSTGVLSLVSNTDSDDAGVIDLGGGWYKLWMYVDVDTRGESGDSFRAEIVPWAGSNIAGNSIFCDGMQVQYGAVTPGLYVKTDCP